MLPAKFLTDIDFAILEYDAKGKVLDKSAIRLSGKMTRSTPCALVVQDVKRKADNPNKSRRDDLSAWSEGSDPPDDSAKSRFRL